MHSAGYKYGGHTEVLQEFSGATDSRVRPNSLFWRPFVVVVVVAPRVRCRCGAHAAVAGDPVPRLIPVCARVGSRSACGHAVREMALLKLRCTFFLIFMFLVTSVKVSATIERP